MQTLKIGVGVRALQFSSFIDGAQSSSSAERQAIVSVGCRNWHRRLRWNWTCPQRRPLIPGPWSAGFALAFWAGFWEALAGPR